MFEHQVVIQLIAAYTCLGVFIFTAIVTCCSLVGWIKFADPNQQKKLFVVLIVEVVVVSVGFFAGVFKFTASPSINEIVVEFLSYELSEESPVGQSCRPGSVAVTEYFRVEEENSADLYKIILSRNVPRIVEAKYKSSEGAVAFSFCFNRGLIRAQTLIFVTKNGRQSQQVHYELDTMNTSVIQPNAPQLSIR